jgi:hypothetical protein
MPKRAIRIITGSRNRHFCRDLFKNTTVSLTIYTLTPIICGRQQSAYILNSDIHNVNTMQKLNFHQHSSNPSLYQKGVHSFGIKVFNNLHQSLKKLTGNSKQFKTALKHYLLTHFFYPTDEYFSVNK